jgi:hypothetical protein
MRQIGIARDYADLHRLLRARAEQLDVSRLVLDEIAGLQSGYSSTLLAPRPRKRLGHMSLGAMLGALGLALVVVEDAAQLARIRSRLVPRRGRRRDSAAAVDSSNGAGRYPTTARLK